MENYEIKEKGNIHHFYWLVGTAPCSLNTSVELYI